MDTITRIAKNSVMVMLARVVQYLTTFLLLAVIPRYLGASLFGDYGYVKTLVSLVVAFTYLGVQEIAIREMAKDKVNAHRYLGAALMIRSVISIATIGAIALITGLMDLSSTLKWAIFIGVLGEVFLSYSLIYVSAFKAFEKMEYELLLQFLTSIALLVSVVSVIYLDLGFIWLFAAGAGANLIRLVFGVYFCGNRIVSPQFHSDIKLCGYLLRAGLPVGIAVFLLQATFKVDVLILKAMRSSQEVAFFHAPHNMILQIGILAAAFTSALFPVLSRMASSNDSKGLLFVSEKVLKFFLIFTLPLSICFTIFGNNITVMIFGRDFVPAAISMQILIWTVNFLFAETFAHFILTSLNKQKYSALSALCGFLTNFALDLILIPKYGYVGASIATVFSYILMCSISFYILFRELGMISIGKIVVKPVICMIFMGVVLHFLKSASLGLVPALALGCVTYGLALLSTKALLPEDIAIFKRILRRQNKNIPQDS